MQQRTAGDAMNALNSAGLQSLAQALENGFLPAAAVAVVSPPRSR